MSTVQDLTTQEQQLKAQLSQLAQAKLDAAENEKNEKLRLIDAYDSEARGYRNQATKADNEADKQRLFRFAIQADENANELRLELGLVSEQELQAKTDDRQQAEFYKTSRKINALLIKSVIAFVAYLLTDFTAGQLSLGFICYVLTAISKVFHILFVALGGIWLVCSLLFKFVSNYALSGLKDDFINMMPGYRLAVLTAILSAVLLFLSLVISQS